MTDSNLRGVAGWLLLLVVGLLVLSPLTSLSAMSKDIGMTERLYPALQQNQKWADFVNIYQSLVVTGCVISVASGMALIFRQIPSTVVLVRIALWVIGPIFNIAINWVLPALIFDTSMTGDEAGRAVALLTGSVFWCTVWTIYLTRSRRVKITYGRAT